MSKKRYFLPYELDAFNNAPIIAGACGLRPADVVYGNMLMWQHVWRTKSDLVTTAHVLAFFGVNACEALVLFKHLEATESGWRVRGAAEWLRVMTAQSRAGKAHSGNLIPGGPKGLGSPSAPPSASAPKSEEAEAKPIGSPSALPATSDQRPATIKELLLPDPLIPVRPPPKEPPDKFSSGASFFAFVQFKRHEAGCVPELPSHPQRIASWWSEVGMELNGEYERLEAALYRFADDPFWEAAVPPMPFNAFAKDWRKYVPQKTAA